MKQLVSLFIFLFEFYGISTFVGYLTQNQFYFKQFSLPYKNNSDSNNLVVHKYKVKMSKQFHFKQFSLA